MIIELKKQLVDEYKRLESIKSNVKKELENAPEGSMRLNRSQGSVQYYHFKEGTPHNGTYIHKTESELVKKLAQKSYDEKILRYTEKVTRQIEVLLKNYEDDKIETIYKAEHPNRQELIIPVEPTYDQQIEKWIQTPFEGKGFSDETPVILTNAGLRVRSKSEKILADYFDYVGIKYKYECPLWLEGYGNVYPDFTFLSKRTGKEIYWEHEGMMDNPEYARAAIKKIETYEKNRIFCGENLILTFEASTTSINTELIKVLVNKYLL